MNRVQTVPVDQSENSFTAPLACVPLLDFAQGFFQCGVFAFGFEHHVEFAKPPPRLKHCAEFNRVYPLGVLADLSAARLTGKMNLGLAVMFVPGPEDTWNQLVEITRGIRAVVQIVKYDGQAAIVSNRKRIYDGIAALIVFDYEAAPDFCGEPVCHLRKSSHRRHFIAVDTAEMDYDLVLGVQPQRIEDSRGVRQFRRGGSADSWIARIEHGILPRVHRQAKAIGSYITPNFGEWPSKFLPPFQLVNGMGRERDDARAHSEQEPAI